jgi:hypothetical protein
LTKEEEKLAATWSFPEKGSKLLTTPHTVSSRKDTLKEESMA